MCLCVWFGFHNMVHTWSCNRIFSIFLQPLGVMRRTLSEPDSSEATTNTISTKGIYKKTLHSTWMPESLQTNTVNTSKAAKRSQLDFRRDDTPNYPAMSSSTHHQADSPNYQTMSRSTHHRASSPNCSAIGPSTYHPIHVTSRMHISLPACTYHFLHSGKPQKQKKSKYVKLQKHVVPSAGSLLYVFSKRKTIKITKPTKPKNMCKIYKTHKHLHNPKKLALANKQRQEDAKH